MGSHAGEPERPPRRLLFSFIGQMLIAVFLVPDLLDGWGWPPWTWVAVALPLSPGVAIDAHDLAANISG